MLRPVDGGAEVADGGGVLELERGDEYVEVVRVTSIGVVVGDAVVAKAEILSSRVGVAVTIVKIDIADAVASLLAPGVTVAGILII